MALRLGLVGHGRWGRNIERTLLSFPDVTVVIVGKGDPPRTDFDGVLIATQTATHADAALPYIEAGVATFIEKPMATSVADAERIRLVARRSGAAVFVGHILLHHPAFQTALELLPSLGAVRYLHCEGMNANPRIDSSVLWDWLPHSLSMAQAIAGRDPESAVAWNLSGGAMPQAALALFQYGGLPFVTAISWLSPTPRMQMTAVCEGGALMFDDKAERKLTLHRGRSDVSYPGYPDELPLTRQMSAFLRAIRSGDADPRQTEIGLGIVRAIAAAQDSTFLDGQPVAI